MHIGWHTFLNRQSQHISFRGEIVYTVCLCSIFGSIFLFRSVWLVLQAHLLQFKYLWTQSGTRVHVSYIYLRIWIQCLVCIQCYVRFVAYITKSFWVEVLFSLTCSRCICVWANLFFFFGQFPYSRYVSLTRMLQFLCLFAKKKKVKLYPIASIFLLRAPIPLSPAAAVAAASAAGVICMVKRWKQQKKITKKTPTESMQYIQNMFDQISHSVNRTPPTPRHIIWHTF